jgi:hypothetical protein
MPQSDANLQSSGTTWTMEEAGRLYEERRRYLSAQFLAADVYKTGGSRLSQEQLFEQFYNDPRTR